MKDFTKTVLLALVSDERTLDGLSQAAYDDLFGRPEVRKARAVRLPELVFTLASKAGAVRDAKTLFWGAGKSLDGSCEDEIRGYAPQSPVTATIATMCSPLYDHAWESVFLYGFCPKTTISVSSRDSKVTVCGKTLTARTTQHPTFSQGYIDTQSGVFLNRVPPDSLVHVVLLGGRRTVATLNTHVKVADTLTVIRDEGFDLQVSNLSTLGMSCQASETATNSLLSLGRFVMETGGKQFPYDCSNVDAIGEFVAGMIRSRNRIVVPLSPQQSSMEVERVTIGQVTLATGDWERQGRTLVIVKEPPKSLVSDTVKVLFR